MTSAGKKLNNRVRWSWTFLAMGILLTSPGRSETAGDTQAEGAVRTIADDSVRGHDLIELAVRRIGGAEKLRGIVALHYSLEGDSFNGLQGYDPVNLQSATHSGTLSVTLDLDYANHRYCRRFLQGLAGGIQLDTVTCFKDGRITDAYPGTGRMSQSNGVEASVVDQMGRDNPVILARRALENISSAIFVGQLRGAGELVDVVEVSWNANVRMRLHLSARDHRILSVETVTVDPLIGDDNAMFVFEGERVVEGLSFPEHVSLHRRKQLYYSARVTEASVNPALSSSLFDAPEFRPLSTEKSTEALGDGAYEIAGIDDGVFRVVFFDLGDGVVVFDAPDSRSRSEWIAGEIRKVLGDKPIKYVVLSHFHDDHVRGVGYYVDRGAQIVTTRFAAAAVARYATANSRRSSDLDSAGRSPSFVFVDGEELDLRGSEGRVISVYKLADCPHAKDMLVAYQPEGKLIVQADLLVEVAPYSPTTAAFATWMGGRVAPRIDWIVGTHQAKVSRADFEAAGRAGKGD
jgi:glyoxylase-like metal-dependent hydrolase (beta-lactamase superfamily II)